MLDRVSFYHLGCFVCLTVFAAMTGWQAEAQVPRPPLKPGETLGVESCRECHESAVDLWEMTAHATSYQALTTTDAAAPVARAAGLELADVPHSASCVRCHFTQEQLAASVQSTTGVSCESCHGAASKWINEHNRKTLTRAGRVASASTQGMNHPAALFGLADACFQCHVVDDEQLVNRGGHPALSDGFELYSWYAGEVKHNFMITQTGKAVKQNATRPQPISAARKRMIFLTGKLLQLARSLDCVARSTDAPVDRDGAFLKLADGRHTFGVQHAMTVRRVLEDMREIQSMVAIPEFAKALGLMSGVSMVTGQNQEMQAAAREIHRLAESFCQNHDGSRLAAIDPMIERLKPRYSQAVGNH